MSAMPTSDPILPFGKHKGQKVSDVPVEYLDWLIGQSWLNADLRELIEAHLKDRPEWHRLGDD